MPKNNDLTPVRLPMHQKFGQAPTTTYRNNLAAIKVELLQAPTVAELRSYLPQFVEATWAETYDANDKLSMVQKDQLIRAAFKGKTLPTALETIRLNFRLSGISLQEVTHILRYRTASFSADCSGDKWWSDKDALIPSSVQQSPEFCARYKKLVEDAKELYCDMIDTKQISIMDARYVLPRCLSTFYYMSISLKDCISFIKARVDKQIQPETDNIIAYQMYICLLEQYPYANGLIDIHAPSQFYIHMARTGKATNLYFPDEDSDKFEWNENDFIYQAKRNQVKGTNCKEDALTGFELQLKFIEDVIASQEFANKRKMPYLFWEEDHENK